MNKKTRFLLFIAIAIAVIYLAGYGAMSHIEANLKGLADLAISDIDLSKAKDGVYTGKHSVFPVSVEVKVTVTNHKIANIELIKHTNGQGTAAEIIPDKVIEAQTLQVDSVSGATYSSKVILKAIENALNSAVK